MTENDFWTRAFLAGINAGKAIENAEKQAEMALGIWQARMMPAQRDMTPAEKLAASPAQNQPAPPKKRGRPPKAKPEPVAEPVETAAPTED